MKLVIKKIISSHIMELLTATYPTTIKLWSIQIFHFCHHTEQYFPLFPPLVTSRYITRSPSIMHRFKAKYFKLFQRLTSLKVNYGLQNKFASTFSIKAFRGKTMFLLKTNFDSEFPHTKDKSAYKDLRIIPIKSHYLM